MVPGKMQEGPPFLRSKRNPVYLVAEIGGNHEGSFDKAVEMLNLALQAGVDAVKFQILRGDRLVSPLESPDRNQHFKRFELEQRHFETLAKICRQNDTAFMASVWDLKSLQWVDPLVEMHKVGSGDLTAFPILRALAETGKPILLATGLSTLTEVKRTVDYIASCNPSYLEEKKLILLQCTASYPNPDSDANLRAIQTLQQHFKLPIGYSDHTFGLEAPYMAYLLGAEVIEFHFTDHRENQTFRDHQISATAEEVREFIERLKRAAVLLGSPVKKPAPSEIERGHLQSFRRSVYAARDLTAGQVLTAEDLTVLRPEHGIPAWRFDQLPGRKLNKDLKQFAAIREEDFA